MAFFVDCNRRWSKMIALTGFCSAPERDPLRGSLFVQHFASSTLERDNFRFRCECIKRTSFDSCASGATPRRAVGCRTMSDLTQMILSSLYILFGRKKEIAQQNSAQVCSAGKFGARTRVLFVKRRQAAKLAFVCQLERITIFASRISR